MKKFIIITALITFSAFSMAYVLEVYADPGCPNPKCCRKNDKTFLEQQVCDQGT